MIWYYAENNAQAGPVSDEQLRELVSAGRIQGATLVWKAGMDAWTPLAQAVPGLAPLTVSTPVAAPSVSSDTAMTQRPFGQLMPETALCESCKQFKPLDELVQIAGQRICANCKSVSLQALAQGELAPGELVYGGFWRRFGAFLMDGLILSPIYFSFYVFVLPKVMGDTGLTLLFAAGISLLNAAYLTFFHGRYSATPGKMIAGLKVVKKDGSPINYQIAAIRAVAEIGLGGIPYLGFLVTLTSFGMVIFDVPQRRAIHDHLVGTRVVSA